MARKTAKKTGETSTAPAWAKGLHPRWRLFIEAYLTNGFNATQAYISAGYSESGADRSAHRLLRNAEIQTALRAALDEACMSAEELKARISDAAMSDFTPFLDVSFGEPAIDWERAQQAGATRHIKKIKIKPTEHGTEVSFELIDRQKAQDQLARIHGLYSDRVELTGAGGGPVETRAVTRLAIDDLPLEAARALRDTLKAKRDDPPGGDDGGG